MYEKILRPFKKYDNNFYVLFSTRFLIDLLLPIYLITIIINLISEYCFFFKFVFWKLLPPIFKMLINYL